MTDNGTSLPRAMVAQLCGYSTEIMSKTTLSNALCLSGAGWFSSSGFDTACVHSRLHERWLAKDSWCRHTYIYRKCPASALSIPLSTTALSFSAGKTSNRYSGLFFFKYAMSMKDIPRVQKLKINMSLAKSKLGFRDRSSSFIFRISSITIHLFTVLSMPQ